MADEENTPPDTPVDPAPAEPAPEPTPVPAEEPEETPAPEEPVSPPEVTPPPIEAPAPAPAPEPAPAPTPPPITTPPESPPLIITNSPALPETPPPGGLIEAQDGAPSPVVSTAPAPMILQGQLPNIGFHPKPVEVTYTERVRGCSFTANNPLLGSPTLVLGYEKAIEGSDDSVRTENVPNIFRPFEPTRLVYLRNPQTGEPFGITTTQAEIYVALYSLMYDEYLRSINDPSMADKPAFPPTE